jgi:delta 1-pyrroline-5-carboxylate dehydrogenase
VSGDGDAIAVENPATEETVAEVGTPSAEQVDAAIRSADEAASGWAGTPAVERAELLHGVATRGDVGEAIVRDERVAGVASRARSRPASAWPRCARSGLPA